jgi:hypothetical protein
MWPVMPYSTKAVPIGLTSGNSATNMAGMILLAVISSSTAGSRP